MKAVLLGPALPPARGRDSSPAPLGVLPELGCGGREILGRHRYRRPSRAPLGARYHAVAEEGVPVKEIVEVIGRRLNVPVSGVSPKGANGQTTPTAIERASRTVPEFFSARSLPFVQIGGDTPSSPMTTDWPAPMATVSLAKRDEAQVDQLCSANTAAAIWYESKARAAPAYASRWMKSSTISSLLTPLCSAMRSCPRSGS